MSSTPSSIAPQRNDDPRKSLDDLISRAIAYHSAPELAELLAFTRRFPYLAPYNAMLLNTQNPGIRFALRAPLWEKSYCRRIRPGARPYVILRTMGPVEFVFDLSDTEPINPNDDRVPRAASNPFATNGVPPRGTLEKMTACCLNLAVEVVDQDFATGMAGKVIRDTKRNPPYRVILNSKHAEAEKLGTLAHELAHVLCGHLGEDRDNKIPERTNLTQEIREFEAEAVAYLVTDRLGIDIGSVSYLSGYLSATQAIPEYSLDMVLKVAGRIELMMMGGKRPKLECFFQEIPCIATAHETIDGKSSVPITRQNVAGLLLGLPGTDFKEKIGQLPEDVWGGFLKSTQVVSDDGAYLIDLADYIGDAPTMDVLDRMIHPTEKNLQDALEKGVAGGLDAWVFFGNLKRDGKSSPVALELFSLRNFLWKITVFSDSQELALAEIRRLNSTLQINEDELRERWVIPKRAKTNMIPPLPVLEPARDTAETSSSGGTMPAIFMVGLLVTLGGIFVGIMWYISATNKPTPISDRELKYLNYIESHKSPDVRAMEAEDALQIERGGRDISGPQDNRGYSDE